jgi:hypothetical protein
MKKLIISIGLLAGATAAYSQGIINWSDYVAPVNGLGGFSITVWTANLTGPPVFGNTSVDLPPGTTPIGPGGYTGTPLSGAGYEIGLYVGTSAFGVQAAAESGTPVATDSFAAGSGGWDFSGSLDAAVPGLPSGTPVYVELAAWSTANDHPTSFAAALRDGDPTGASLVSSGTTVLGGLGGDGPPVTPGNLAGLGITDFTLRDCK